MPDNVKKDSEAAKKAKARAQRIPTKEFELVKDEPKGRKKGSKIQLNATSEKIYREKGLIK